jgi:hypothetical protein
MFVKVNMGEGLFQVVNVTHVVMLSKESLENYSILLITGDIVWINEDDYNKILKIIDVGE